MAKHVIAQDEQGFEWIVFTEDPGWQVIKRLPKSMEYYAIPRKSLKTGEVIDFAEPFFYTQEVPDELLTPELSAVIVRLERIYRSMEYLNGEGNVSD